MTSVTGWKSTEQKSMFKFDALANNTEKDKNNYMIRKMSKKLISLLIFWLIFLPEFQMHLY